MLIVLAVPKRHTIFRFEIPQPGSTESQIEEETAKEVTGDVPPLAFELHGSQFEVRAPDRATKKFKQKHMKNI